MKKAIAEDRLRLPSFDCPNATCTAKNLVFAASAETRNHAKLVPLKDVPAQVSIDFIVYCPKCKQQFAMIQVTIQSPHVILSVSEGSFVVFAKSDKILRNEVPQNDSD